jgi:hypothetical protein
MESTKKGQRKKKRNRPRGGRRGEKAGCTLTPTPMKSDAKRFSSVWKKSFPPSR